jgi:hypothetical protein
MQGSSHGGLSYTNEEVWSWSDRKDRPAVRRALQKVHHAARALLAPDPEKIALEILLEGRDEHAIGRLAFGEEQPPEEVYLVMAVLRPDDAHLAAMALAWTSRWYVAGLLEGEDNDGLLQLLRALGHFLEAHKIRPREVLTTLVHGVDSSEEASA